MRHSIAFLAAVAGATMAADTIEFYFPGGSDGVDPVATIKTASPSTTVMHLACPSGADSNDCGWGPGLDYTIISKTHYQASLNIDNTYSISFACDHNMPKTQMVCAVTMSGGNDDGLLAGAGPQTATLSGSQIGFNKATIIQGANLLSGGATVTSATSAAAGSAAGSASAKATGLQTAATPPASGSGASAAQASKTTSGSAAPAGHTGAATKFGLGGSALLMFAGGAVVGAL